MVATNDAVLAGTERGTIAQYQPQTVTKTPRFERPVSVGTGAVATMTVTRDGFAAFVVNDTAGTSSSLGFYDIAKRVVNSPLQPILSTSAASVAAKGDMVYVGGAGSDAVLIAYSRSANTVVKRVVPVPRATAITGLAVGSNGHLYGVADATLFELDPETMTVLHAKPFYKKDSVAMSWLPRGVSWRLLREKFMRSVRKIFLWCRWRPALQLHSVPWVITTLAVMALYTAC
ncbi:hypothetical protein IPL68_01070 [Candidatus Saccharibacteria bacterium]|nr:MAG: hypothetical protein IPL68_01070 [Candidatus Saccharibacteria bacterium]